MYEIMNESFMNNTKNLLFSSFGILLLLSMPVYLSVFAQSEYGPSIEELIEDIQKEVKGIEDLNHVWDEAIIVDVSIEQISELKNQVNLLVDDDILRQELLSILDLSLLHLKDAGNFILAGNEVEAINSINESKNVLAKFVYTLKNTPTVDSFEDFPSIKTQVKSDVAPLDIICKEGFQLVFKQSDNSPACVKPETSIKLVERGWGHFLQLSSFVSTNSLDSEKNLKKLSGSYKELQIKWQERTMSMYLDLHSNRLYVSVYSVTEDVGNQVNVINTNSNEIIKKITLEQPISGQIRVDYENQLLYARTSDSSQNKNYLYSFDLNTGKLVSQYQFSEFPSTYSLIPNSNFILVSHPTSSYVSILDVVENKVIKKITMPHSSNELIPNSTMFYSMSFPTKTISVIDPDSFLIVEKILLNYPPDDLAFDPNHKLIYITTWSMDAGEGSVLVMDSTNYSIVNERKIDQRYHSLKIDSESEALYTTIPTGSGTTILILDPETLIVKDKIYSELHFPLQFFINSNTDVIYASGVNSHGITVIK